MEPVARAVLIVAVVVALLLVYLYLTQRSLIYFPSSSVPDAALLPPRGEQLTLETDDGLRLGAWFIPPIGHVAGPAPAVLVFNGNAGDRSHRLDLATRLVERGYAVMLFDYRGYGGNPGSPSEDGLRRDARAALSALTARADVDPDRVAYFGESLGAAVAGGLATELPPAALMLRSPPPSMADMGRHHYPYLPVIDALLVDRYALVDQVRDVRAPLLVIVTEHDEVVPAALSRRVFDTAPEPKRWVALAAAHHNDPALFAGDQLIDEVSGFLDRWLGQPTVAARIGDG
ncbi:MAG TPA: alpha/beta fold hydrolase [Candidatus Limnocylindria bacterium]|nr:alpha/beta fold hydrolase [Candidatus Limnocylindria bacterium]